MSLLFMLASAAFAQDTVNTQYLDSHVYRPPVDADGMLWTESADAGNEGLQITKLHSTYIFEPVFETEDIFDDRARSQALRTDIIGAAGVEGFQIAVDVPIYTESGSDLFEDGNTGIGDLAVQAKANLLEATDVRDVALGVGGRVILPTADEDELEFGVDAVAWEAMLMASGKAADRVNLAANVGTRGLPDDIVETDSFNQEFFFRAGAGYDLVPDMAGLSLDVVGAWDYDIDIEDQDDPLQGFLGAYGRIAEDFVVKGGLGSGLIPGDNGPAMRGTLAIGWEPQPDRDVVLGTVATAPGMDDEPVMDRELEADNRVTVRVRDESGRMLDNANVRIEKDGRVIHQGVGELETELEPGLYTLHAMQPGFQPVMTEFRVYPDDTVDVTATLTTDTQRLRQVEDEQMRERELRPTGQERDLDQVNPTDEDLDEFGPRDDDMDPLQDDELGPEDRY